MATLFYYDLSSPYAYLCAERIDGFLPDARWQPIAFGALILKHGRRPWSLIPGEREAGIAEVESRASERGLPPVRWHVGWPAESYSVEPARAALWAQRHGAQRDLALALFRRSFVDGSPLNKRSTVLECAGEVGLDTAELDAALDSPELKQELRDATDAADAAGVYGVPTIAVDGALYWGDDRLEEAAA